MCWTVVETWRDPERETLMFRIKHESEEIEVICGVTDTAINEYCITQDTPEYAQSNFAEHQDFIVSIAVALITNGNPNDRGHFVITSKNININ